MGKSFLNKAIGLGDRSTLRSAQIQNAASIAVLLAFALALYATSDRSGGFWWFDSASHAFNGVFLHDFFRDREFSHPFEWAVRYFDQYPAITLGFYPPGFAILLVPFYWVFGPNQAAAQALMASASFALGAGTLRLARQCGWDFATALAASVVLVTFPEMLLWERQIQPEVAAYALTIWGCCLLLDWLDCGSSKTLYWAVVLLVGALYVKQTVVFILPVLTLLLIVRSGSRIFWRREVLWAAGIALILLLPLAAITVAFGGMNVEQATAVPRSNGALYYLWALPHQIGWLALLSSSGRCRDALSTMPGTCRDAPPDFRLDRSWAFLLFSNSSQKSPVLDRGTPADRLARNMAFHAHCAPRDQGLVQCRCSLRSRSGQPLYHPHSRRIWIRRGSSHGGACRAAE